MAVNCWVSPAATDGFPGVTAIDMRTADPTVSKAVPSIFPELAVIPVLPAVRPLTSPVALIEAIPVLAVPHVTDWVRSCVLPSEYLPTAFSCSDSPSGSDDGFGLTTIPTNAGAPTVTVVLPVRP